MKYLYLFFFLPLSLFANRLIETHFDQFASYEKIPFPKKSLQKNFLKLTTHEKLQVILEELGYLATTLSDYPHDATKLLFYNHPTSFHPLKLSHIPASKKVIVLWEPTTVKPDQYTKPILSQYGTILTFRDDLVKERGYHKFYYPCLKSMVKKRPPFNEKKLVCAVIANKFFDGPNELYSKRKEIIHFYEKNFPHLFALYGRGWKKRKYKTYRGAPINKTTTMKKYKFAYCLENTRNVPGYVTEKIFDCFAAGVIPIYLGANNIDQFIPSDCFIDMRHFETLDQLHQHITSISEEEHGAYIKRIKIFLNSKEAHLFSDHHFLATLLPHLVEKEELDQIDWEAFCDHPSH